VSYRPQGALEDLSQNKKVKARSLLIFEALCLGFITWDLSQLGQTHATPNFIKTQPSEQAGALRTRCTHYLGRPKAHANSYIQSWWSGIRYFKTSASLPRQTRGGVL
jgi:hypothetical protein